MICEKLGTPTELFELIFVALLNATALLLLLVLTVLELELVGFCPPDTPELLG